MGECVIVVHGGAGAFAGVRDDRAAEARLRDGLRDALRAGQRVLVDGGAAVDAVEQAVRVLEDCEAFNAGRGSVLTSAGTVEMDAAIMCGERLAAGAVACVSGIVHPVSAARLVMDRTPHVLLVGPAAEAFAAEAGLATAEAKYFVTAPRRAQLERARSASRIELDHGGTVGAVALDCAGHLAAATSTGGMSNQMPGRVGDSPLVGAGTWAADGRCAVSATGAGELIIRACLAHEIDARMRFAGQGLEESARDALIHVSDLGGGAGCITVDAAGRVAAPFLTDGMVRGFARGEEFPLTAIWREALH